MIRRIPLGADLHIHSHYSDGHDSPHALIDRATELLGLISICDHDTIEAYDQVDPEYLTPEREPSLEMPRVLPGIEISAQLEPRGDLHLLGYFPNGFTPSFRDYAASLAEDRSRRIRAGITKLRERGIPFRWEQLEEACRGVPCRSHVCRILQQNGVGRSFHTIFDRFLRGDTFERPQCRVEEAIEVIQSEGGLSVWAHPRLDHLRDHLKRLSEVGLRGVEAFGPTRRRSHSRDIEERAHALGLFTTGGSDHHGTNPRRPLGSWRLAWDQVHQELY